MATKGRLRPMSTTSPAAERETLMEAYLAAWNSRKPDAVAAFFTSDATYDDRGAAEIAHGTAGIRAHVETVLTAFPDLTFEVVRAAHGEDFSAGEWRASMTHLGDLSGLRPTGRRVESAGVDVATIGPGGLISHLVSYYDGAAIMRGLGLIPEHGSRLEGALVRLACLRPRRRNRP